MKPKIVVKLEKPVSGYWDGGSKNYFEFEIDMYKMDKHPGPDVTLKWGSWGANFWFNCGSGRSWKEAASIAKRRLEKMMGIEGDITVEYSNY